MSGDLEAALALLARKFGARFSTSRSVREHHSHGEGLQTPQLPAAVVHAHTTQEVAEVAGLCHRHRVPLVPFGAGTSLEGQIGGPAGGISLDLSAMTAIETVNAADMDCRVQAGVTRQALNAFLRDTGLFFSVDPGGEATIGGMCATRASGTSAVRYGTIRENVLGLTVVLADGRILRTGGRARKSATGYDLTRLMIGSEGTLGIITEVQLRLQAIPETIAVAVCQFRELGDAVGASVDVLQTGTAISKIELLDDVQMDACIRYSSLSGFGSMPTLFFEFGGSPAAVAEQVASVASIVAGRGAEGFRQSGDAAERTTLWKARHDAFWACTAYRPGCRGMTTDAVVPISALVDMITGAKADILSSGLLAPIVGHVGDGNFHTVILVPPEADGLDRALALDRRIIERALSLGGAASGEHGIGTGKRRFMASEHDAVCLDVMHAIKACLDPHGILNPGKLLPDRG